MRNSEAGIFFYKLAKFRGIHSLNPVLYAQDSACVNGHKASEGPDFV